MDQALPPQPSLDSWLAIPGPVDRESFFEAQRRHRRSTWRLSAVSLLVILIMGLATSAIITPVVTLELLIFLEILDIFLPIPSFVIESISTVYQGAFSAVEAGISQPFTFALGLAAFFLPGTIVILLGWLWLRRFLFRSGVGGVLYSLGAREPRSGDLEEQQIVNIVQEMGIAAGIAPPRVLLLDSDVRNAAVIGSSPDDAVLIIPRRLLDELDRDETQGVMAHLVGSAANGDLRIALILMSVFQSFGLVLMMLDLPFTSQSRRSLWTIVRYSLSAGKRTPAEASQIGSRLSYHAGTGALDDVNAMMSMIERPGIGRIRRILVYAYLFLLLPLILGSIFARLILWMTTLFLLGPLLAFTWRTRRYLADATAVQLTRNPDGLARSLNHLAKLGGVIAGGRSVAHLFIVGPEAAQARAQVKMQQRFQQMRRKPGEPLSLSGMGDSVQQTIQVMQEYGEEMSKEEQDTFADKHMIIASMHPPLNKRLKRLASLGALQF